MTQPTILKKILDRKAEEVSQRKQNCSLNELEQKIKTLPDCRGFSKALADQINNKRPAVIAEIKKASPSVGIIREDFDPEDIAISYAENGATCLSVLTDTDFFQGEDTYVQQVRNVCKLPVIRKDFIIDPYQVFESRALGADCILLIVAALKKKRLKDLISSARETDIDFLIEVHNQTELEIALGLDAKLIGINNRDLHTFKTNLNVTFELLESIPEDVSVITESGILLREDVEEMIRLNVYGFLVGESFMRAPDPGARLHELFFFG